MLAELNRETQSLYRDVRTGVVRVQLPRPHWIDAYARAPLEHWQKLDPDIRKRLEQQLRQHPDEAHLGQMPLRIVTIPPASRPTTAPSRQQASARELVKSGQARRPEQPISVGQPPKPEQPVRIDGQGTVIFVPTPPAPGAGGSPPSDPVLGARLQMDVNAVGSFEPNNVGLLIDADGHVLIPLYIERETIGESPVRVGLSDGKVVDARFVGSDRQTNLTLIQLNTPAGKPVVLSNQKPVDGSLVLYLSPQDGSGRLGLWNGGQQAYGIVFGTDGRAAGIARYGQFLGGSACRLIAEQLIRFGAVKRATLGVLISEIRKDDPLREQLPVLGTRSAVRVDEVIAHSAADKAGIKSGDLLLALAGESVSDIPSFAAAIAARSGHTELQVLRGKQVLNITVDLEQQK